LLKLQPEKSSVPLLGVVMKLLALRAPVVTRLNSAMVFLLVYGQRVLMLLTMERDMKEGWTIEEYIEYVKHILKQAEKDTYKVG
jgi:hypothetical protein